MKKILLLMLLVLSCTIQAQNKFEVIPKAAFDIFTNSFKVKHENSYSLDFAKYRVRMGIDGKYKSFTVSGDIHTYISSYNGVEVGKKIDPTTFVYFIAAKYNYKQLSIKYEYMNMSPINTDGWYNYGGKVFGRYSMVSLQYNY